MINIKSEQEIAKMAKGGRILANILEEAKNFVKPGMTKLDLDNYIEKLISKNKAIASFKNFNGYQHSSCISINDEIVHGVPNNYKIKLGDIISLDIGVYYKGYHTDSAITFGVGKIPEDHQKLIELTKKSLDLAVTKIRPGAKIGDIQKVIQNHVESQDHILVRDFAGHGIGINLQEDPVIPNYYGKNSDLTLKEGMVICIEPMVIIGKNSQIKIKEDNWTVESENGNMAAHFEHTIAVIKNGAKILTSK